MIPTELSPDVTETRAQGGGYARGRRCAGRRQNQAAARATGRPGARGTAVGEAPSSAVSAPAIRRSVWRRPIGRRGADSSAASTVDPASDVRGLGQQVRERDVERLADGGEQLAGRFLAAALDLRQVAEADPGRAGHVAERATAGCAGAAEAGTDRLSQQQRHATLLIRPDRTVPVGSRYRLARSPVAAPRRSSRPPRANRRIEGAVNPGAQRQLSGHRQDASDGSEATAGAVARRRSARRT